MEHSAKFEMIRDYYDQGLWNEKKVKNAVVKGLITAEEFKEITGKDYS